MKKTLKNQEGQTMLEYILMLFLIVGVVVGVIKWLKSSEFFFKKISQPMMSYLRYNYKYGDPTARGWDEGGAKKHVQISVPDGQTFRMFVPRKN